MSLSSDILQTVLNKVPSYEIQKAARVCRLWKSVAEKQKSRIRQNITFTITNTITKPDATVYNHFDRLIVFKDNSHVVLFSMFNIDNIYFDLELYLSMEQFAKCFNTDRADAIYKLATICGIEKYIDIKKVLQLKPTFILKYISHQHFPCEFFTSRKKIIAKYCFSTDSDYQYAMLIINSLLFFILYFYR